MADVKIPLAEPSSVPEGPTSLTPELKAAWNEGKPFEASSPSSQESAPAPAQQEAQPVNAAESGAAPSKQESRQAPKKLSADERIAQLEATIERIKQGKEATPTKAAPSPAPQSPQVHLPKPAEVRAKPTPNDKKADGSPKFTNYEEFTEDLADWKFESRMAEQQKKAVEASQQQSAQQQAQERAQKWGDQVLGSKEKHGDFEAVALNPQLPIFNPSPIFDFCTSSEFGTEVLYELGKKGASEIDRINRLPIPMQFAELARMEAGLKPAEKPVEATTEKETPAPPVTKAPKPPSEVGGRGTAPEDPGQSAARSNDFRAAKDAWNSKAKQGSYR